MNTAKVEVGYIIRRVAQNYRALHFATIATYAQTLQRFTQRPVLLTAETFDDMSNHKRDTTQVYTQSQTSLERSVYVNPSTEINMPAHNILSAVKPLYNISESKLYSSVINMNHHISFHGMPLSRPEPCPMNREDEEFWLA